MVHIAVLRALRSRSFALLWLGQTISGLGDGTFTTALAWTVLLQTGSATAIGSVMVARSGPMLIFLPVGGVAADRLPRRLLDKLGRVSSVDLLGSFALLPLGYALAGVFADRLGPAWVFLAAGSINIVLIVFGISIRGIRDLA